MSKIIDGKIGGELWRKEKGLYKTAIVSGVCGQDGSYLVEHLLDLGYDKVIGLKRRTSTINTERVDHIYNHPNFEMKYYDLNDAGCVYNLMVQYSPDEVYNLAAQSHVRVSFDIPYNTVEGICMGTLHWLEAIKTINPNCKFYQASSSEMFGDNPDMPKSGFTEESRLMPASPYACAKVFAHNLVRNYRESYNLHASSGILFNHESPRRGETFVTRKITIAANKIKAGLQDRLVLGNLSASRDWGYAGDYVKAMHLMLQQEKPDDYVIATGKTYTVEDFLKKTFEYLGLGDYKDYVDFDPKFLRPQEVPCLLGNASKAKKNLGWKSETNLDGLVKMMCDSDMELIKK